MFPRAVVEFALAFVGDRGEFQVISIIAELMCAGIRHGPLHSVSPEDELVLTRALKDSEQRDSAEMHLAVSEKLGILFCGWPCNEGHTHIWSV